MISDVGTAGCSGVAALIIQVKTSISANYRSFPGSFLIFIDFHPVSCWILNFSLIFLTLKNMLKLNSTEFELFEMIMFKLILYEPWMSQPSWFLLLVIRVRTNGNHQNRNSIKHTKAFDTQQVFASRHLMLNIALLYLYYYTLKNFEFQCIPTQIPTQIATMQVITLNAKDAVFH